MIEERMDPVSWPSPPPREQAENMPHSRAAHSASAAWAVNLLYNFIGKQPFVSMVPQMRDAGRAESRVRTHASCTG